MRQKNVRNGGYRDNPRTHRLTDGGGGDMLSAWIVLMLNSLFFTLRLSGNTGSFPRPLKAEEERAYLELARQGDMEARNVLVEHNLRLVAHIVKNG